MATKMTTKMTNQQPSNYQANHRFTCTKHAMPCHAMPLDGLDGQTHVNKDPTYWNNEKHVQVQHRTTWYGVVRDGSEGRRGKGSDRLMKR